MTDAVFAPIENLARDVVVVAVVDSECGRGAVVLAADEACRRGAHLILVQVCSESEKDCARSDLERLAGMVRAEYPWLSVRVRATGEGGEQVLLEESGRAVLLVLPAQAGQGGADLAASAACPVIQVRHRPRSRPAC